MNHRNNMSVGHTSRNLDGHALAAFSADELDKRFSFQSYSEDTHSEEDDSSVAAICGRRALLDKRLLEEIYEQIALHGELETKDLLLQAYNGIVTIDGTVSDRAMRAQIGSFVRKCPFVKSIVNRVRTRDTATADGSSEEWQQGWQDRWQDRRVA